MLFCFPTGNTLSSQTSLQCSDGIAVRCAAALLGSHTDVLRSRVCLFVCGQCAEPRARACGGRPRAEAGCHYHLDARRNRLRGGAAGIYLPETKKGSNGACCRSPPFPSGARSGFAHGLACCTKLACVPLHFRSNTARLCVVGLPFGGASAAHTWRPLIIHQVPAHPRFSSVVTETGGSLPHHSE